MFLFYEFDEFRTIIKKKKLTRHKRRVIQHVMLTAGLLLYECWLQFSSDTDESTPHGLHVNNDL